MRVSYCSDLHLEFNDYPSFKKEDGGDVLLLAGDIVTAAAVSEHRTDAAGRSLKKYLKGPFKRDLLDKYAEVYMVMGNHEHYQSYFGRTKSLLVHSFKTLGLPIRIMDNDWASLQGEAVLIGSTLWSDFEGGSPLSMACVGHGMNDFRIIAMGEGDYFNKFQAKPITPEFILNEHRKSVQFVREIARIHTNLPILVMTHHGPTNKSLNAQHVGNGLDGGYCSDLSEFILDHPQITHWVHGHTHASLEYKVGETAVVANQRGYAHEPSHREFKGLRHFTIGQSD